MMSNASHKHRREISTITERSRIKALALLAIALISSLVLATVIALFPSQEDPAVQDGSQHQEVTQTEIHSGNTTSETYVPEVEDPAEKMPDNEGDLTDLASIYDTHLAAIRNLNKELLDSLRRAESESSKVGITLGVSSAWRSPELQGQMLREAVSEYGSEEEAAKWVATAETSEHVKGEAVDIGLPDAQQWLSAHGAEFGLCQIYVNEPWHFELRSGSDLQGCPPMYSDPRQDPRLRN